MHQDQNNPGQNNPHHYLEIKLLQRIAKKHDDDLGYKDIDAPALDSPCVLFLGGGDAQSSNVANWQAKISQLMLTGSKTKFPLGIKLVSATYPNPYLKGYGTETELQYMRADPNFHDIESDILAKKQFLPLVADNLKIDSDDNISGDKIDLNRLKKNFRNINIIAYSYGGVVAEKLGNSLRYYMDKLGYEKEQIDDAMQEISLLTLGNITEIPASKNNFTKLHIINDEDKRVVLRSTNLDLANHICKNEYDKAQAVNQENPSDRNMLILHGKKSRIAFFGGESYAFYPSNRHDLPDMINFIYEQDNKTIIPSPAELFVAASVNNSRRNTKVDELIPLPTTQALLEQMPHQARMLQSIMQNGLQL